MASSRELLEKRRSQLHEAALTCFGEKGYHQTTMDDVAGESGLSKGTLYWYFDSKKDLFLSLCRRVMDEFEAAWRERLADDLSPTDKLLATLALFRREMEDLVPLISVMIEAWALMRHDEEMQHLLEEMYQPYLNIMAGIIREGVDSGELHADSPDLTGFVVMTFFDGLMLALGTDLLDGDWEEIVDAAEALVLRGLKGEG